MTWGAVAGGALGLAGSIYGANKAEEAAEQSQELPEWLKPYITGSGSTPSYIDNDPLINTNWLDYITRLSSGEGGDWQPMTGNSPFFQPEKTFTPDEGGAYGQLPAGFDPYGQAPVAPQETGSGLDIDALTNFLKQKQNAMFVGGEAAQYGNTPSIRGNMRRMGNDMSYDEMEKFNELAGLLGR